MIISDKEHTDYAMRKLSCAISNAIGNGIPLTSRIARRVETNANGVWAPRKRGGVISHTYALDAILLNRRSITYPYWHLAQALGLPNMSLGKSIEDGFSARGYQYTCEISSNLSIELYNVGAQLLKKYRNHIGMD